MNDKDNLKIFIQEDLLFKEDIDRSTIVKTVAELDKNIDCRPIFSVSISGNKEDKSFIQRCRERFLNKTIVSEEIKEVENNIIWNARIRSSSGI